LWSYFKKDDLIARANKINAFQADVTAIIHYNISTKAKLVKGYFGPTTDNYSMMFTAGSFAKNELNDPEKRMNFLRLLLTDDIERSVELCDPVMAFHRDSLGVPAVAEPNDILYLNKYSLYLGVPGVYARNLRMTRMVQGPICFGESLLQDNKTEATRLNTLDDKLEGEAVSSRLREVAKSYFLGVRDYLLKPQYPQGQ